MQYRSASPFTVNGYTFESSQTLDTRGKSRIGCWFSSDYQRVRELDNDYYEILVFKNKKTGIVVAGVYHPFKCFEGETVRTNFERLVENLTQIANNSPEGLIMIGDFNVNYENDASCPLRLILEEFCTEWNLDQIVDFITRSRNRICDC